MREKREMLIITFHTTSEAIGFENACRTKGAPGRLIPVPRAISAGCGMAWCAMPAEEETLSALVKESGIEPQDWHRNVLV